MEKRELKKQLDELKVSKKIPEKRDGEKEEESDKDEDVDDFFSSEEKSKNINIPELDSIIERKVKPIEERLKQRESEDRKNQRDAFFKNHPEYMDTKRFTELLDEMDNSINPKSKDNHYTQLEKAHRILTGEKSTLTDVDEVKRKMASDMSSKGDGALKTEGRKTEVDERAERLAKKMPIGFEFKVLKK